MKVNYRVEGLCCASCADKIEDRVKRLDGVTSAKVSFMTAKMALEVDESKLVAIEEQAAKIVKKIEPDATMVKR